MKLKVGDVVWLKSGGPPMTVVFINEGEMKDRVDVKWFDERDEIRTAIIVADALIKRPGDSQE